MGFSAMLTHYGAHQRDSPGDTNVANHQQHGKSGQDYTYLIMNSILAVSVVRVSSNTLTAPHVPADSKCVPKFTKTSQKKPQGTIRKLPFGQCYLRLPQSNFYAK